MKEKIVNYLLSKQWFLAIVSQRFLSSADDITSEGLECGLEDLGITNRYEAMQYGFDQCKERTEEALLNVG